MQEQRDLMKTLQLHVKCLNLRLAAMPGLSLPLGAVRPGAKSPQATPPASPARSLPGTLLPLTGLRGSSPCVSPSKGNPSPPKSSQAGPSFDLKALIPDHLDEDIFARRREGPPHQKRIDRAVAAEEGPPKTA